MVNHRPLAVTWYPGCFGNFILGVLELQKNKLEYDINELNSHDILSTIKKIHGRNPTQEETKIYRNIFPYFPNEYRFLPNTFHYIKFFKDLPTEENFKKFDIKEFFYDCKNKKEIFYKSIVTHFWLYKVNNIPKNVYSLDITELFLNTNKFKLTLENLVQEKLQKRTEEFIEKKKKLNLTHFQNYNELLFKIKKNILNNKEETLENFEDYFKCLLLADIIDYKQELYDKFLKNYKGQELITTSDIGKIFI